MAVNFEDKTNVNQLTLTKEIVVEENAAELYNKHYKLQSPEQTHIR